MYHKNLKGMIKLINSTNKYNAFINFHPFVLFIYFLMILIFNIFVINPVFQLVSLVSALCLYSMLTTKKAFLKSTFYFLAFIIIISITNPLFTSKGRNVLFFIGNHAIALESLLYGINIAIMLTAVICWCFCFKEILTGEKFLFLFNNKMPKLALLITIIFKLIEQFKIKIKSISQTQTALGLNSNGSFKIKVTSALNVFSVVITQSLENSIETANSMNARGFGTKKRTMYKTYKFNASDFLILLILLILCLIVLAAIALRVVSFNFFPIITKIQLSKMALACYASYSLLLFAPFLIEIKEKIKWKYFESKI